MQILKQVSKTIKPLLDAENVKKLDRMTQRTYVELQQIILNDIGRGSIFENITKLNNEMQERLNLKVDMQEKFMLKMQDFGKHLMHKASVDLAMEKEADKGKKMGKEEIKALIEK